MEIPKSVRAIGERAFCDCDCLEKVSFQEGSALQSVGAEAFAGTPLMPGDIVFPITVDGGEVFRYKSESD